MDDTVPDEQTERPAGPPSLDMNDPLAKSLVTTEPGSLNPNWTVADSPEPEVAQSRMQDFLRAHAIAHRSFDEVQSNWKNSFGDVKLPDQDAYKSWQDRADREGLLDRTRAQAATEPIRSGPLDLQNSRLNQVGMGFGFMQKRMYNAAKERFDAGEPTGQDYGVIANYERTQALQQQDEQGGEGRLRSLALGAPAMIAQMHMAAPAIGGVAGAVTPEALAGASGLTAGAARLGIRAAAMNAVVPGMGPEAAIEGFSDNGVAGAAKGFAKSFGRAVVMEASFGTAGKLSEKLGGLAGAAFGALGATVAQQGVDAVNYATGLSPRYGAFQDFREGKKGEAAAEAVMGFLTNVAIVGASHPEAAKTMAETFKKAADANYGRGQTPGKGLADAAEKAQEAGRQIIETAAQNTRAQEPAPAETAPNAPGAAPSEPAPTAARTGEVPPSEATGAQPAGNAAPAGKPSTWLTEAIDRHNQDAERAGVADLIEQRAGEGAIGATIVKEIKPKLAAAGMDPADARTIVNAVRSRRGIPSQDDTAEFAKWQGEWRARQEPPQFAGISDADVLAIAKATGVKATKGMSRADAIAKMTGRTPSPAERSINESVAANPPPNEVGLGEGSAIFRAAPAIEKLFPDAEVLPGGGLFAKTETHNVTIHPAGPDGVEVAFTRPRKSGVGQSVETGSLSAVRTIFRQLMPELHKAGVEVEYVANDAGKRGEFKTSTADIYARQMERLGFELVSKPDPADPVQRWRWKPSDPAEVLKELHDAHADAHTEHTPAEIEEAGKGGLQSADDGARRADSEGDDGGVAGPPAAAPAEAAKPAQPPVPPEPQGWLDKLRARQADATAKTAAPVGGTGNKWSPAGPDIADIRHRLLNHGETTADELKAAGLTDREITVLHGRAGKTSDGTTQSLGVVGARLGVTKERARQIEQKALGRLGESRSWDEAVDAESRAARQADLLADGKLSQPDADIADRVGRHAGVKADAEEQRLTRWADWLTKQGKLSDVDQASIERRIRKGEPAPGGRGQVHSQAADRDAAPEQRAAVPPDSAANAGGVAAQPPVDRPAPVQSEGGGLTPEQLAAADAKAKEIAGAAKPPEPKPPQKPMPPFEREWRKKAADAGLSYDDLKAGSDQVLAENAGKVDEHNEIVRQAISALREFGGDWNTIRAAEKRGDDYDKIKGFDDVADQFGLDSEQLWEKLKEGLRRPLTKTEAHQASLDEWNDHQEAERAKKEAQGLGWPRGAAEEALRRGQADGRSEADDREGDASGGDLDELLAADVGDFDPHSPTFGMGAAAAGELTPGGRGPSTPKLGAEQLKRPSTTALANANLDAQRTADGFSPVFGRAAEKNPELYAKANAAFDRDPDVGKKLAEELVDKPRPVTPVENLILLRERVAKANEYRQLDRDYQKATLDGIDTTATEARLDELQRDLYTADAAARRTGTDWHELGMTRQQLMAEDFSLEGLIRQFRTASGREPTREELQKLVAAEAQIKDLQEKLTAAEKAYSQGNGKPGTNLDVDLRKARVAVNRKIAETTDGFEDLKSARRPLPQKMFDALIAWQRFSILSGVKTLGKIASASAESIAVNPAKELAGAVWGWIPGIARIAAKANVEGGLSLGGEAAAAGSFFRGIKDGYEKATTGRSELDVMYGKESRSRGILQRILEFPQDVHAALKAPAMRAAYERVFMKGLAAEAAAGRDATSPAAVLRVGAQAYQEAHRAIFMEDNKVSEAVSRAIDSLRNPNNSFATQAIGTAAKTLLPIVKVPTNVVAQSFEAAFGVIPGLTRAALVPFRGGIAELKPEQANLIMRQLKAGSIGGAMFLLGAMNPKMFGGFYTNPADEKKRQRAGDTPVGAMKVGGVTLPAWTQHNPVLIAGQMGASFRRTLDKTYRGKDESVGDAFVDSVVGLAKETPLFEEPGKLTEELRTPAGRGRWFGQYLSGFIVPRAVKDLSAVTDPVEKRKAEGTVQTIQREIPWWRKKLPVSQ